MSTIVFLIAYIDTLKITIFEVTSYTHLGDNRIPVSTRATKNQVLFF